MKAKDIYHDLEPKELVKRAEWWIKQGYLVYFKFTCDKCGSRQTFDTPNILYEKGKCEECGHITQIKKGGFMVVGIF